MKKIIISGDTLLAELGIIFILGLTPILFNYFYPTSIDLCKIVVFKVGVLLLLFSLAWRFLKFKLTISKDFFKQLFPFGLLFVFLIFSLFFSVNITASWFGSYNRQEGLVSWLFYGFWAILVILYISGQESVVKYLKIRHLLLISSFSGLLVSLYALLQIFGIDFVTWAEPAKITGRAVSSFGQPNYLACWLVIVLPFSAYLFKTSKSKKGYIFWALVFLFELGGLLSTGSRSVFLTFLIISIIWLFWFLNRQNKLSAKKILIISLSAIAILALFLASLALSNLNRLQEFTDFKKGSIYVREELFNSGWQAFLKKPWLGYGLENQTEAYAGAYKIDWAIYSRPNTYSDRAHNLILDTMLTGGIVGLVVFLYFLYWIYANLFKAYKKDKSNYLPAFLLWSLTVYLVSLLFNFSVTATNIYFWLIVGLSLAIADKPIFIWQSKTKKANLLSLVLLLGTIAILFYGTSAEIKKLAADYYYNKALNAVDNSEYFKALVLKDYFDEDYADKISNYYYNEGLSLRLLEQFPKIHDKSSFFVVSNYLAAFNNRLPAASFEDKFVKAFIMGIIGQENHSIAIFKDLSQVSPELPKIYLAWGDVLLYNHDYQGALAKFEKVINLLPDSNSKYLNTDQRKYLDDYKSLVNYRLVEAKTLLK